MRRVTVPTQSRRQPPSVEPRGRRAPGRCRGGPRDLLRRHAERRWSARRGVPAGDDHRSRAGQRRALAGGEPGCLGRARARSPGTGGDGPAPRGRAGRQPLRPPSGMAPAPGRRSAPWRPAAGPARIGPRRIEVGSGRERKAGSAGSAGRPPARASSSSAEPPVVEVASGPAVKIAREGQDDRCAWGSNLVLVGGPGDVALPQGDLDRGRPPRRRARAGRPWRRPHPVEDVPGQELGRGVAALEQLRARPGSGS